MIENQEELRTALEKNREQKERIKQLEAAQASKQDSSPSQLRAQLEELQTHVRGKLGLLFYLFFIYLFFYFSLRF